MKSVRGFTLVELLIAISIIAVLSVVGLSTYTSVQKNARDARRKDDLRSIRVALELYYQKNGQYPSTEPDSDDWYVSNGSSWIPELVPSFMAKIPTDPKANGGYPYADDATSYGYGYWAATQTGCPAAGQFFALVTKLENTSDSQRNGAQNYKWCDGSNLSKWSPNNFVISSQD